MIQIKAAVQTAASMNPCQISRLNYLRIAGKALH